MPRVPRDVPSPPVTVSSDIDFAAAFQESPALFALSTMEEGRYLAVNDAFVTTLGFTREEVIGHASSELNLWHDLNDRKRLASRLQKDGAFLNEEVAIRKKNGESIICLFSGVVLQSSGKRIIFTFASDITERKRTEFRMAEEMKKLAETVRKQQLVIAEEKAEIERLREELQTAHDILSSATTGQ